MIQSHTVFVSVPSKANFIFDHLETQQHKPVTVPFVEKQETNQQISKILFLPISYLRVSQVIYKL